VNYFEAFQMQSQPADGKTVTVLVAVINNSRDGYVFSAFRKKKEIQYDYEGRSSIQFALPNESQTPKFAHYTKNGFSGRLKPSPPLICKWQPQGVFRLTNVA
jgi:hypothetical protein